MDADLLQRFNPEEFYRHFLADGLRPDGRSLREPRRAELQRKALGSALGSASLRLGRSSALAGVRGELDEIGRIEVSVDLPPLCSALFREKHRALGQMSFLSKTLTEVLNLQSVFDATQLVCHGEASWVLHVHIICLNYDGNAFDLCLLAAIAALEDTDLPALMKEPGTEAERLAIAPAESEIVAEARKLVLLARPLPVTFARMPGGQWVQDPCAVEESLGASVSLCLVDGRWLVFHQGGGADANRFLEELMPVARTSTEKLAKLLDDP
ncbi:unnamed protein product [Durusdinium trenchii]|uniref:Ribosomal RNA-processing protein 43 n=2 Tax=Durusdinium trenchii TaxID=1381693 RepID=A0ABP0LVU6_9DINO